MRIIAGMAKGHPLQAPKGLHTRPTSDRAREALFNILQSVLHDARVLDLYAGTGALGIESLSRGAGFATFVEQWKPAVKCIQYNLASTRLRVCAEIFQQDVFSFLDKCQSKYDLVFADPPYRHNLAEPTLAAICSNNVLNDEGIVIIETSKQEDLPEKVLDLENVRKARYGDTVIWIYKSAIS